MYIFIHKFMNSSCKKKVSVTPNLTPPKVSLFCRVQMTLTNKVSKCRIYYDIKYYQAHYYFKYHRAYILMKYVVLNSDVLAWIAYSGSWRWQHHFPAPSYWSHTGRLKSALGKRTEGELYQESGEGYKLGLSQSECWLLNFNQHIDVCLYLVTA